MKKFIVQFSAILFFVCATFNLQAAQLPSNISPQQLEQFKKLAPAQQKSLAQSMGIDIRTIQAQLNKSKSTGADEEQQLQQYYPRGTEFDELGNPILPDDFLEEEEDDGEPKPFGYDVFANAPMTFAPTMDIAIPDDYVVGSGDTLSIQMFGKENQDHELTVSREGKVVIPELGPFSVSGLTFVEMKKSLRSAIKNKVLGVDVVITLSQLRAMRVFVLGDAYKPGPYVLSALSSITHALFSAGGINDIGSLRNIQLKRAGKLVTTLDLYDLLIKGDSSNDLMLKSGDVIFVAPVGERVTIAGEVRRPAIYELGNNENFEAIIKMAGGLLPSSYPSSTVVERYNQQNLRSLLNIDLSKAEYLNQSVKNGDYVRVMKTSELFDQSVTVIGAVSRPGKYQWQAGQRVTDLLPDINAYLLNNADLMYSVIVRQKDVGRNIEVLQFGLFNAISDVNSADNLLLQPQDKILVFSNVEVPSIDITTLDSLAWTREELLEKEKEKAESDYEDRLFWAKYGEDAEAVNIYQEQDLADETLKLAAQSLEELTDTRERELDVDELGLFSRKRLLIPVIQQLTRQAAFGQPLQIVEVAGAVKFPGVYPLTANSQVKSLVLAAGGLLESAYLTKAEVTRSSVDQFKAKQLLVNINLQQALNEDVVANISLQSKDRLNIHHIPAWQENHIIELRGEFLFPGKYTIKRGETLAELIVRVGGFTEFAYTDSSFFTRKGLKQLELQNIIKVSENLRSEIASKSLTQDGSSQGIDYAQAKLLLADLTKVTPVGRLVVDVPRIMSDESFDVTLEDGDMLYIPAKQNSVNVIGQVQVATSHIYQTGLSAFDYVNLSGGAKKQADDGRIYVIKANGAVEIPNNGNWFSQNNGELEPGDTVVVPLDSYYMEDLTLWTSVTQIVYNAAIAMKAVGIFN
ncbi:MAG: SLBB domain-containing protein [Colwellia sp.]|nr:SLBB domain-containing protein [Colwellia sp.]